MESFWSGNSAELEYDTWCHDASVVKVDRRVLELTSNIFGPEAARTPAVLDDHCSRVSTDDTQSRLFSDTRASDGGVVPR